MADQIICTVGCCPGCQDCWGMSIGCHQQPCRCDRACTCRWEAIPPRVHAMDRHTDQEGGKPWTASR